MKVDERDKAHVNLKLNKDSNKFSIWFNVL